jgi:hypothetical protein
MASEVRFLLKAPTQNQQPDSSLLPNADFARPHYRNHNTLACISCYKRRQRQNLLSIFPYRTNSAVTESSMKVIGYHIATVNGSSVENSFVVIYGARSDSGHHDVWSSTDGALKIEDGETRTNPLRTLKFPFLISFPFQASA